MSFKKLPVPPLGTLINARRANVLFKGSNVPCVHLGMEDGKWVALNPSLNYGLIAYITEPSVIFLDHLARIEIFEISPNRRSVFARAIQVKPRSGGVQRSETSAPVDVGGGGEAEGPEITARSSRPQGQRRAYPASRIRGPRGSA